MGGVLFLGGLVGLSAYLVLRVLEIRRGSRWFDVVRKRLDELTLSLYRLVVFGEVPTRYRMWLGGRLRTLMHGLVVLLVGVLRALERPLSRINHRLRISRREDTPPRDPSPFLKTIADATKKNGENGESSLESKK